MKIRYLTLLTTLAFLCFSGSAIAHPCEREPGHMHCDTDPGGGPEPEYTAELTRGDFVFGGNSGILENLTVDRKGTSLPGNQLLEMDPMVDASLDEWDKIFQDCSLLVTGEQITGFDVQASNWSINYTKSRRSSGNVYIAMRNLRIYPPPSDDYTNVDFDFDLHGVVALGESFLPTESGGSIVHELTEYKLWAGAGGQGGFTCNSDGRPALENISYLKITRTK